MIDRDFWTSATIAPIGALAELRALVLARSKKRVTLPTVALGSFRATTASAGRARRLGGRSQLREI
jgi:hypothetical protein